MEYRNKNQFIGISKQNSILSIYYFLLNYVFGP